MTKLQDKVALVTGAGRGIGREIARKLGSEGARLVVNDLDREPAEETVALLAKEGIEATAFPGSVTEPDFGERFVRAAQDTYGRLDIIVNNAGYTWDSVIHKTTDEQFDAMLDVHLRAPFRILRAATGAFREAARRDAEAGEHGVRKVVNISSVAGLGGNVGQAGYASGKAGVVGLTRTLAKEWGRYQVTVNAVAFGLIATRLTDAPAGGGATIDVDGRNIKVGIGDELRGALEAGIPLGRAGTPEDAAGAVCLFTIPESDYITGQVVVAGGGLVI
ncbi:3-oxoacyl-[acyl-carrier protein] reductase [Streptomyces sp. SAI-135]|jgi:3-oxoacyl-[acyl-carrier protein] reductase|uniref:SDR family NAD(P)-dependent oxidoreductase n=1 Tax=unclassified Streptomyces TaxID=2593676 RepID=UPI0024733167|nr:MULTISPECIES: SDR family oxidoreductase [unclassified Streptomyces]MDH6521931.1 3-oxoacyl-[acyl-carrier protein] reductase [Streptomyces sp. SAI-090]MDH6573300.1 3-oxoacyl-[acyl-carrier protein] reductase [Streptomyces sp. SAI-117]MDH6613967.1 3-oxoacyl-[acyl-carrier protein] reductase [Streptomyces sp. SAI-135]